MIDPGRAERDDEDPIEDIDIDDDAPAIVLEYAQAHGYPARAPAGAAQGSHAWG